MSSLGPDIALNPLTGDLDRAGGTLKLRVSVAQKVKIRLRFIRREWFLDRKKGLPYFERIFIKGPNLDHLGTLYRTAIAETPGVHRIIEFSVALVARTRRLTVNWSADSEDGVIQGAETVPV